MADGKGDINPGFSFDVGGFDAPVQAAWEFAGGACTAVQQKHMHGCPNSRFAAGSVQLNS